MGWASYLNDFIKFRTSVWSIVWVRTLRLIKWLLLIEYLRLALVWKVTMDEQKGCLQKWRLLCELLDWITSVLKNSLIAINVRDLWSWTNSVHVSGIVYLQGFLVLICDSSEVFSIYEKTVFALFDADLKIFPRSVVGYFQEFSLHHLDRLLGKSKL